VPLGKAEEGESEDEATNAVLRWLRQRLRPETRPGVSRGAPAGEEFALRLTPASQITLSKATLLAGERPVGSHHLLLAALADSDSAAARTLTGLGVNLDQARDALRAADITNTTDEQPEEAGRRQMVIHVAEDKLTIEAADPLIVTTAQAALRALGDEVVAAGEIRGDQPGMAGLAAVWRELHDTLAKLQDAAPPEAA
jgi:ATP-dependent Clp protease ATP-binding subunit ClpA